MVTQNCAGCKYRHPKDPKKCKYWGDTPIMTVCNKYTEADAVVVIDEEEMEAIEKAAQEEPAPQECENCFIFPDEDSQTITITPVVHGAFLRLNKSKALALAAIIQDCAHKL